MSLRHRELVSDEAFTEDDGELGLGQIMTPGERDEHRRKMFEAQIAEARERVRQEHHDQMVERAKERGITLPEEMPAHGPGGDVPPAVENVREALLTLSR